MCIYKQCSACLCFELTHAQSPLINSSVNNLLLQIFQTVTQFISVLKTLLMHALFRNGRSDGAIKPLSKETVEYSFLIHLVKS